MQLSIFSSEELPASPLASPDSARDWMTRVVRSCSPTLPLLAAIGPDGWSGRTSPVSCPPTTDGRLAPCSEGWQSSGMGSPTAFLTLSTSDWPSDGAACVGHLGDWRRAAAVLFERESLSGHPAPRREAGQEVAGTFTARANSGGWGQDVDLAASGYMRVAPERARALTASSQRYDSETETFIAHALRADGFDASEDGTGRGTPLITEPMTLAIRGRGDSHDLEYRQDGTANALLTPNGGRAGIGVGAIAFSVKDHGADAGDLAPTLRAGGHAESHANGGVMPAVAFHENQRGEVTTNDTAGSLKVGGGKPGHGYPAVAYAADDYQQGTYESADVSRPLTTSADRTRAAPIVGAMQVRRLTPRECERLQGFPDDYTLISYRGKPAADGPRYKALGNSMAVPVMAWIGRRIQMVEEIANG